MAEHVLSLLRDLASIPSAKEKRERMSREGELKYKYR